MSFYTSVTEMDLKTRLSQPQYMIVFKPLDEKLYSSFEKEYPEDNAGVDLYCREDVEIAPGKMAILKLGIIAKMIGPEYGEARRWMIKNYNYWLLPRSSISKKGLVMANSVGVIDKSYRGELMGAVVNVCGSPVKVTRGERLFQIVAPDMGYISQAKKALKYNDDDAENDYLMKEKAYEDALSEINWPNNILNLNAKDKIEWLEKNHGNLYSKLYNLQYNMDGCAMRRPSFVSILNNIQDGKWVAIIDGGLIGPFNNEYEVDVSIQHITFKKIHMKVTKMKVNKSHMKANVMDDTSRGIGGFGSTGS